MTTIKESNEQLNAAQSVSTKELPRPKSRRAVDLLALTIATCGVGYFPIAPGTIGSLVGIGLYLAVWTSLYSAFESNAGRGGLNLLYVFTPMLAVMLLLIFIVSILGVWAATRAEKTTQKKDPSIVVIDEVAGQMIALLSGPFWIHSWWSILSAFVLFRLFDIWKPYPIRRLEALESGLGIMADDLLAGVYALIVNSVLISSYLLLAAPG
jgi:phosphatidylglycerophosphatase A